MISFPHAKINLGLYILNKRPDGFHNLESLFLPVPWCDILEILPSEQFLFTQTGITIPDDGKANLCIRAYELLKKDFNIPPVSIFLHKVIPIGAGLGGGSSDASFTLRILKEIFQLELDNDQLQKYASQLGSDCAFFTQDDMQFCYEKGDIFEGFKLGLGEKYLVMVYPDLHISTKEAYSKISPKQPEISLKEALQYPINDWKKTIQNDFEIALSPQYPIIQETKGQLYDLGAIYAAMSGSGSTIYGIFDHSIDLNEVFPQSFKIWQGFFKL